MIIFCFVGAHILVRSTVSYLGTNRYGFPIYLTVFEYGLRNEWIIEFILYVPMYFIAASSLYSLL